MSNLATLPEAQGKLVHTKSFFRQKLGAWELALGEEHPDARMLVNSLAALLTAQGRRVDMVPFFRRALGVGAHARRGAPEQARVPGHPRPAKSTRTRSWT